jgi:cell division protease FtsH
MITDFGMSDKLVLRTFGTDPEESVYGIEQKDYSEAVAKQIDDEVQELLDKAHEEAKKLLSENRDRLDYLAEKLIEVENLEGADLIKVFTEPIPDKAALGGEKKTQEKPAIGARVPAAGA